MASEYMDPEKFLRRDQKYSLEKYRSAPEKTLTPEEERFIDDYICRFSEEILKRRPFAIGTLLRALMSPSILKLTFEGATKLKPLLEKEEESKEGQLILAQKEAEEINEEYARKVAAVQKAVDDFTDFTESINIRHKGASPEVDAALVERVRKSFTRKLRKFIEADIHPTQKENTLSLIADMEARRPVKVYGRIFPEFLDGAIEDSGILLYSPEYKDIRKRLESGL